MKLLLLLAVVLWITVSLEAKREREGSSDKGGQRREREDGKVNGNRGRRRNGKQPFPLFPSCKDFNGNYTKIMKELKKEYKVGSAACEGEDRAACFLKHRDAVRCELSDEIPQECLQEIDGFLKGGTCITTEI